MAKGFKKFSLSLLQFFLMVTSAHAQTDYNNMANWAFHPDKSGTLIDGFNIDIAVVDENLATTSVYQFTNNSMTNTGVDVFFVHPTILQNLATYTEIETVPIADQNTLMVALSIRGQVGLLSKYGRMFAPRYRQATPPTFVGSDLDSTQVNVLEISYTDIKDAFLNYLNNHNNGNKIILVSHSQGAYLAGFLLRDVFDSNPQLQQKLVTAVIAGIAGNYAEPNLFAGGWWQNIPFCTQEDECGCVMNWRSYKEGQTPPAPQASHPCLNPLVVDNGWAYSQLDLVQNWLMQDSLYYNNQAQPLRNFITLRSNVDFGGNVGYVAFDSLYTIRHQRSGTGQVGFVVQHTPQPNEQRPDLLLDEESNPLFSSLGYHAKDYNIYSWALLEQIDMKLSLCGGSISVSDYSDPAGTLSMFPNPASDRVYLRNNDEVLSNEDIAILDVAGKIIVSGNLDSAGGISIQELESGFYLVVTKFGVSRLFIE